MIDFPSSERDSRRQSAEDCLTVCIAVALSLGMEAWGAWYPSDVDAVLRQLPRIFVVLYLPLHPSFIILTLTISLLADGLLRHRWLVWTGDTGVARRPLPGKPFLVRVTRCVVISFFVAELLLLGWFTMLSAGYASLDDYPGVALRLFLLFVPLGLLAVAALCIADWLTSVFWAAMKRDHVNSYWREGLPVGAILCAIYLSVVCLFVLLLPRALFEVSVAIYGLRSMAVISITSALAAGYRIAKFRERREAR